MATTNTMEIDSETKEEPNNASDPKSTSNNENNNNSNSNTNTKNTKQTNKTSRKRKIDSIGDIEMKDPPKKKRKKSRGWSEEEEKLFLAGLALYGRNWKKISAHVGHERNAASIRSHAQIYFLKALQKGTKLPAKVLESGNGFTLSGKPLNKYSAVAIRHFGSAAKVPMTDGVISDEENAPKRRAKKEKKAVEKKVKANNNKLNKKKKKKRNKYYDSDSDEDFEINLKTKSSAADATTTSATKRRSGRNRKKVFISEPPHISNPYGLRTDIQIYDVSNANESVSISKKKKSNDMRIYEPFAIEYCPHALLIAHIHSHLLRSVEIMGLLGGIYDSEKKVLYIKKCYPLREQSANEQTVHADDLDMLSVSEIIQKDDGLQLIGWYHSHPCFENVPSNLDCFQHASFQRSLLNDVNGPFVGLIIQSLWDKYNSFSDAKWFNTIALNSGMNDCEYMALQFNTKTQIYYDMNNDQLFAQIKELIERYDDAKYDIYRTNLGENNIDRKMLNNIEYLLKENQNDEDMNEDNDQIQILVKKIEKVFLEKRNVWWVTNRPKINGDNNQNHNNNDSIDDKENENCLN